MKEKFNSEREAKMFAIIEALGFKRTAQNYLYTFQHIEFDLSASGETPADIMSNIINQCINRGRDQRLKETQDVLKEIFGLN